MSTLQIVATVLAWLVAGGIGILAGRLAR